MIGGLKILATFTVSTVVSAVIKNSLPVDSPPASRVVQAIGSFFIGAMVSDAVEKWIDGQMEKYTQKTEEQLAETSVSQIAEESESGENKNGA